MGRRPATASVEPTNLVVWNGVQPVEAERFGGDGAKTEAQAWGAIYDGVEDGGAGVGGRRVFYRDGHPVCSIWIAQPGLNDPDSIAVFRWRFSSRRAMADSMVNHYTVAGDAYAGTKQAPEPCGGGLRQPDTVNVQVLAEAHGGWRTLPVGQGGRSRSPTW